MISAETVAELEDRRLLYIFGVRERIDELVRRRLQFPLSYLSVNRTAEDGRETGAKHGGTSASDLPTN